MPRQFLSVRLPFKRQWLTVVGQTDGTFAIDVTDMDTGDLIGETRVALPHHLTGVIAEIHAANAGKVQS